MEAAHDRAVIWTQIRAETTKVPEIVWLSCWSILQMTDKIQKGTSLTIFFCLVLNILHKLIDNLSRVK